MKRWLFAVGTLFLGAVTSAQADYVWIEYDLGVQKNQGNQQPGMAGMGGMRGMQGMMGRQGMGGPMGPGGGMGLGNMQDMMRGMRGGGAGGGPGGVGPGGGRMFPGGGQAAPGGARRMPGDLGGRNPGFFPGIGGQQPNPSLLEDDEDSTSLKASAVIEVKKWTTINFRNLRQVEPFTAFTHDLVKGGKTGLYKTADIYYEPINEKTVDQKYKARRDAILKGAEKSAASYQDLAKWVLNNGKVDEFPKLMEEWEKIDADNPALTAFKKVKAELNRPITKDDPGLLFWQNKLEYRVKQDAEKFPHYTLLSSSTKNLGDTSDLNSRMKRLEDNYKAFFYWFALEGKALPVPDYHLVAVLVDRPIEFETYHKVFDNVPRSDDGFYARRENLVFFSATPLDEVYDALEVSMKDLWGRQWNRETLLRGGGAPSSATKADSVEVIRNQVKVLLLKALQDESELVAATHEGTLQLASVTGLLPRTVAVPEWAEFGLASFFETSKGAWWPGTGAPNHQYLTKFKKWQDKKILDNPPETALKKVITDQYFREARASNQSADWTKARTMAWSLTYFLASTRLDALMNYYQELGNLPRDMEFDEEILLACFVRAFKLDNPDNPGVARPDAMQKLAQDWYSYMATVQDQYSVAQKYQEQPIKKPRGGAKKGQY